MSPNVSVYLIYTKCISANNNGDSKACLLFFCCTTKPTSCFQQNQSSFEYSKVPTYISFVDTNMWWDRVDCIVIVYNVFLVSRRSINCIDSMVKLVIVTSLLRQDIIEHWLKCKTCLAIIFHISVSDVRSTVCEHCLWLDWTFTIERAYQLMSFPGSEKIKHGNKSCLKNVHCEAFVRAFIKTGTTEKCPLWGICESIHQNRLFTGA